MVSWIWIIVAVLASSILSFLFFSACTTVSDKEKQAQFKKEGYAEAVKDMRIALLERMAHIEILLERMQKEQDEQKKKGGE